MFVLLKGQGHRKANVIRSKFHINVTERENDNTT